MDGCDSPELRAAGWLVCTFTGMVDTVYLLRRVTRRGTDFAATPASTTPRLDASRPDRPSPSEDGASRKLVSGYDARGGGVRRILDADLVLQTAASLYNCICGRESIETIMVYTLYLPDPIPQ